MKKQYLIGLLGVTAISVPIGSSLLNTSNFSTIPTKDLPMVESGIAINTSSVSFYDLDQNGSISGGDKIAEANIEGTIGDSEEGWVIDTAGSTMIYDAKNSAPITDDVDPTLGAVKYDTAKVIKELKIAEDGKSFTFEKSATADDEHQLLLVDKTELNDGSSVNFALEMESTAAPEIFSGADSTQLGSVSGGVSLNSGDLINNYNDERTVTSEEVVVDKEALTATISYDVKLLSDIDFATEKITLIEWVDLGADGIVGGEEGTENEDVVVPSDELDWNKGNKGLDSKGTITRDIVSGKEYNNSLIRVTTDKKTDKITESNIVKGYDENTLPPVDDSTDKLGGGAIFGIIVAVFLGVGLLAGLGYWLYKKYGNKAGSKA